MNSATFPRPRKRKGFLLSLDAVIAIGLILSLAIFIGSLSMTYYSPELRYQRLYYTGKDLILLLDNARVEQLQSFGSIQYYQDSGVLTQEDQDKTLMDIIGSFWSSDNSTLHDYAANITGQVLNSTLPASYNYQVLMGGDIIYQRGPSVGSYLARLSSVISGVERGKPIEGYFARSYPSMVGDFNTEYIYFGGYVGQGNMTVNLELPAFDSIVTMDMELDAGDEFDLYINGTYSGTYQEQTNDTMRSSYWHVDPSYYNSFGNGTNTIGIRFPHGGYIGGGYIKVVYNTSDIITGNVEEYGDNATKTFFLPGIQGIVNLYSSIYVPGTIHAIDAFLHYSSNVTVTKYLSIGNVTLFEDNATGELTVSLSNQSISANLSDSGLDMSFMSGMTTPIRFGLKNISYILGEAGFADVVMITDRTGSMESGCDVDTACRAGLCDSWDPCHDRRSHVAVQSDSAFINTILEAEGNNYVGLIGYGERHGSTCSFHEITSDNSSLQQRVADYDYGGDWEPCGWTCTSCGVAGATEMLQEYETLYNLTLRQAIDRTTYALSSDSRSLDLDMGILDKTRFVKSRLSLMARNVDVENGYQDCIFLNGNYLGRVCESNSMGSNGWHSCTYVVESEWLTDGDNSVQATAGGPGGCFSGGGEHWMFKDTKLMVWEFRNNQSVRVTNSSSLDMNLNMIDHYLLANITELQADYPNPVDFTSGLNTSGNTFGLGSAQDGWDWESGTYGFSGTCNFFGADQGELVVEARGSDESCAYGVEVEITPDVWSLIQSGGHVAASLFYEWDGNDDPFEGSDEAWVKGRWTSPSSGTHNLGSHLDGSHSHRDSSEEIYAVDNPDDDFSGFFYQDITSWVEGTGTYYLDFGGKLDRSWSNEYGNFSFDDIAVSIFNSTESSTRFSFPGVNMSYAKAATLSFKSRYVDPDHYDCVFVNGYHIGKVDYQEANGSSVMQEVRFDIPVSYLTGDNLVEFTGGTDRGCNRTGGNDPWIASGVNLTIVYSNETYDYLRKKSMLIMSDGDANTRIGDCANYGNSNSPYFCPSVSGWQTPSEETVAKACDAHDRFNISIYAIAFGNAGQDAIDMLQAAACCDNCTHFYTSNDADELQQIYSQIAQGIINSSWVNQTLETSQEVGAISALFPDSFIRINYSSFIDPPEYGEVTFNFESNVFGNMSGNDTITDNATFTKEGWFYVPENVEIVEAKATSYSSQFWTDRLYVKNESGSSWERVYWLGDFDPQNYSRLGDPFIVNIPVRHIDTGNNSVRIGTGFGPNNATGGSTDTRILYTGRISGIALEGYSDVFEKASGSTFTVYYDIDGDNVSDGSVTVQIGSDPSDIFDPMNDSIDNAFMRLMDSLNVVWDSAPGSIGNGTAQNPYDGDITNPIDFQINSDIRFDSTLTGGVPSLWGPVVMEVRVWN